MTTIIPSISGNFNVKYVTVVLRKVCSVSPIKSVGAGANWIKTFPTTGTMVWGIFDGFPVGERVGSGCGANDGWSVGGAVGFFVGLAVGKSVGDAVGNAVGDAVGLAVIEDPLLGVGMFVPIGEGAIVEIGVPVSGVIGVGPTVCGSSKSVGIGLGWAVPMATGGVVSTGGVVDGASVCAIVGVIVGLGVSFAIVSLDMEGGELGS